ncbi:hypothetical protein V2G26_001845 [Clonostachys chloroleuca]
MSSRSDQACRPCKRRKRRCDKGLPECSLCRRTGRLCEYGSTTNLQPTSSDWGFLRARLDELENRLECSPRTAQQCSLPTSTPASDPALASSIIARESMDTLSTGPSSATSSFRSTGFTPAYSTVEDSGPNSGAQFPASMFLDIDYYIWSRVRLPAPRGAIPASVLALLSQGNVVLDVSQDYFATIHAWLPMISKKRMDMGFPVQNAGPDLAMLFLGMKLVTAPAPAHHVADCAMYTTAKDFLARLERNGAVSLLCLQAMALVALYEYGHAIYPAAWMTIGSCTRYSDALGLNPGDYPILGQATTWTEAEERRRVWWSIYILDKIVSMGSRRRCLVPDPQPEGRLPVDDEAWDCGDVRRAIGYSTHTPYPVEQSGFARLCQASIYLGRAIDYARENSTMSRFRIAEITSLTHELTGFAAVVDNEHTASGPFTLLAPQSITRSALFVLLDRFTCPEKIGSEPGYINSPGAKTKEELELQKQSVHLIELASEQLHALGTNMLGVLQAEVDTAQAQKYSLGAVSPFIMDSIYAGAATFHWLLGENGKDVYRKKAADFNLLLATLGPKWRLGSVYRELLMMHDASARVAAGMAE